MLCYAILSCPALPCPVPFYFILVELPVWSKTMLGTPRIKKPVNGLNTPRLIEEMGKLSFYGLKSLFLGTCLPNDKAIVLSMTLETPEETLKPLMSLVQVVHLSFLLYWGSSMTWRPRLSSSRFGKAAPPPTTTSINLQALKRVPVLWSKSAGIRISLQGGVSSSLSLLSRTFPNTGQIVRPAQGGWTAVVFHPPRQLLAFHRNQRGSTCEAPVCRWAPPCLVWLCM